MALLQEKESRFGWWDGIRPVTPAPYRDEDVEEEEKAKSKDLQRKKEFLERMKKRKLEAEKEKDKETSNIDQGTTLEKEEVGKMDCSSRCEEKISTQEPEPTS